MDKGKQFFISTVIILLSLIIVSAAAKAGDFDVTYRTHQATPDRCLASYSILVEEEGARGANSILEDYFDSDTLRAFASFAGQGEVGSREFNSAYRTLKNVSWNQNATQVAYCISYNTY